MHETEDTAHINNIIKGDYSAYRFLVDKYKDKVYNLSLKMMKNETDAEELTQISFIKAYNSLHKFQRKAAFSTWLYRINYNSCLTQLRLKRKNVQSLEENIESSNLQTMEVTFNSMIEKDRRHYVSLALEKLKPDERILLNLCYKEDKNMNEIGVIMNLSHSNVRVKLMRTRNKLLQIMNKILKHEIGELL
ncbi:MAG: sigma-70 family RNA polymerase sigma factor [Cyclobacteriaceae bacterium]|nr:sigma-70 family RNA polymerase sigma factor [Cyclobacteriaceae bacterium]